MLNPEEACSERCASCHRYDPVYQSEWNRCVQPTHNATATPTMPHHDTTSIPNAFQAVAGPSWAGMAGPRHGPEEASQDARPGLVGPMPAPPSCSR